MTVKEILVKNVITKTNLPGADYVANPYTGCSHSCIYCYAEFMKRFTNHHEKWGEFVDVKINAPQTINNPEKYSGKTILFSSVTDPYQPLELKYELTKKILKKLLPAQPRISILTKSHLAERDMELFKKFDNIEVGVSVSTLDNYKNIEPYASPPEKRIETLKKIHDNGIRTYIFISPIIPGITDYEKIIEKTKFADYYMFENINIRPHNKNRMRRFMKEKCDWDELEKEIKNKYGKKSRVYFHHGGFRKRQGQPSE